MRIIFFLFPKQQKQGKIKQELKDELEIETPFAR